MQTNDSISMEHALKKFRIPPMPQIAERVMQTIGNPMSSAADVEEIIRHDQGLSTHILVASNTAAYRRVVPAKTLRDAIVRVGMKRTRDLVIALSAGAMDRRVSRDEQLLWRKSVATAIASQTIGNCRGCGHETFVVGLLHNVGKRVLRQYSPSKFSKCLLLMSDQELPDYLAEEQIFGTSHNIVGEKVLSEWKMQKDLTSAILHYSQITTNPKMPPSGRLYAFVLNAATKMVDVTGVLGGQGGDESEFYRDQVVRDLNIAPEMLEKFKEAFAQDQSSFL